MIRPVLIALIFSFLPFSSAFAKNLNLYCHPMSNISAYLYPEIPQACAERVDHILTEIGCEPDPSSIQCDESQDPVLCEVKTANCESAHGDLMWTTSCYFGEKVKVSRAKGLTFTWSMGMGMAYVSDFCVQSPQE